MKANKYFPSDIKARAIKYIGKKHKNASIALEKAILKSKGSQEVLDLANKVMVLEWLADLVQKSGL